MRSLTLATILLTVFALFAITSAPATAYGGHYGGGHHGGYYGGGHHGGYYGGGHHGGYYGGGHYGGHHGGHHYGYGYPYRYSYYGGHHGGYGHGGYYGPYSYHGGYHSPLYSLLSIPAYVAYAALSVPAAIVGGYGHGYDGGGHGDSGHYNGDQQPDSGHGPDNATPPGNDNGSTQGRFNDTKYADNWDALAQGSYHSALRGFGDEATAQPRKGTPKIGYALASAMSGDLDRGAWAMKRALKYDPESLNYLQLDAEFKPVLEDLIGRYETQSHADAVLMTASLHFLNGDSGAAGQTLAQYGQYRNETGFAQLVALVGASDDGTQTTEEKKPPRGLDPGSIAIHRR